MSTVEELQQGWCKTDVSPVYEDVDHNSNIPLMAAVKDTRWDIGSTIYIKFLDGDSAYNAKVQTIANEWVTNLANLKFVWLGTNDQTPAGVDPYSVVRITLRDKPTSAQKGNDPGHWSFLGTQLRLQKNLGMPTMNFDMSNIGTLLDKGKYGYGTVLHEFGHMLGLNHEQLRPDRTIQIDETKAVDYYKSPNMGGWDKNKVQSNILRIEQGMVGTLQFDPQSIMMYWFPNEILSAADPKLQETIKAGKYQNGVLVYPENNALSPMDREWIQLFYPMDGKEKTLHQIV